MPGSLEFALGWAFLLLPLPLLIGWSAPAHRERQDSLQVPYFQRLVRITGETPSPGASVLRRWRVQALVSILGWTLLVLAAARPEWVEPPITVEKSARDLMLALDLSGSMSAQDFALADGHRRTRLQAAKAVLRDFTHRRRGDRLGLIVFGDAAYLQAPFTADRDTWLTLLDETEVAMAGHSTALGDAIGLAMALFEASKTENRVLILLTDGNDTGSRVPPIDAAVLAAAAGVTIYTLAVGDPRTVGEEALDRETLTSVARATGGRSYLARDGARLAEVYAEIDALEPARYDTLSYRARRSLFHLPLGAFAALYLVALPLFALLGWRRRRFIDA